MWLVLMPRGPLCMRCLLANRDQRISGIRMHPRLRHIEAF